MGALKKGEVLPDVDVEEEVELTSQEKLDSMLMEGIPGEAGPPSDGEGNERRDDQVRADAVDRMRGMTASRDSSSEDRD